MTTENRPVHDAFWNKVQERFARRKHRKESWLVTEHRAAEEPSEMNRVCVYEEEAVHNHHHHQWSKR